jgi:transcriptional regulator GlxA family with amidase domain
MLFALDLAFYVWRPSLDPFATRRLSHHTEVPHDGLHLGDRAAAQHILSKDDQPVSASNGISALPAASIGTAANFGTVITYTGIDAHLYDDHAVFAWLGQLDRQGADTGGMSLGSHLLPRAGLLGGYRCSSHRLTRSG